MDTGLQHACALEWLCNKKQHCAVKRNSICFDLKTYFKEDAFASVFQLLPHTRDKIWGLKTLALLTYIYTAVEATPLTCSYVASVV